VVEVGTGQVVRRIPADATALCLGPDGVTLAWGGLEGVIHLYDLAAGRQWHRFAGHRPGGEGQTSFGAGVTVLTFTPDGKALVSGGGDTTLLVWDLTRGPGARPRGQRPVAREVLESRWPDLAAADAARAYAAVWDLAAAGDAGVAVLQKHLHPAAPVDPRRVAGLITGLDDRHFAARARAARALEALGEQARPFVGKALAGPLSPEVRRRLEQLRDRLKQSSSPVQLREGRAVAVLELADTAAAREWLRTLARGAAGARLTREARAALARLAERHAGG
jgi:hypothetical protein